MVDTGDFDLFLIPKMSCKKLQRVPEEKSSE